MFPGARCLSSCPQCLGQTGLQQEQKDAFTAGTCCLRLAEQPRQQAADGHCVTPDQQEGGQQLVRDAMVVVKIIGRRNPDPLAALLEEAARQTGSPVRRADAVLDARVICAYGSRAARVSAGPLVWLSWEGWEAHAQTSAGNLPAAGET